MHTEGGEAAETVAQTDCTAARCFLIFTSSCSSDNNNTHTKKNTRYTNHNQFSWLRLSRVKYKMKPDRQYLMTWWTGLHYGSEKGG